jgi:large subunit ribosomal protein L25
MIKEIQYHPVTDDVVHIDLMRVRRSEKITISVPIVLVGDANGVKEGGVLSQAITQIEISCYPTDVPDQIELNIADMEINTSKNVADIQLENDDIEILSSGEINIASVHPPAAEEEPEVEELEDDELAEGDEEGDSSSDDTSGEAPSGESGDNE